jgi:uncharacterized membrane protein YgdD (TMEM256/DUF423 family)
MTMIDYRAQRIAAFLGFSGVLFGAFGAHILRSLLEKSGTAQIWQTGVLYHLVHSVVLLVLSGWRPVPRAAYHLILGGVIVFSGSLYLLAATNLRWFGAITPLGGLSMLAGWLVLALAKGDRTGLGN